MQDDYICTQNAGGVTLSKIWKLSLDSIRLSNEMWATAMPLTITSVLHVKKPRVHDILFFIMKPFIGKRVRDKIYFLNSDQLAQCLDVERIPIELGGEWQVNDSFFTDERIDEIVTKVHDYWDRYPVIDKSNK